MKKAFLCLAIFLFTFFVSPAKAHDDGGIHALPWCTAKGPVYLVVQEKNVEGYIGLDRARFARETSTIYGEFKSEKVNLIIYRGNVIKGQIGDQEISWSLSQKGDVIYGFQPCPVIY